MASYIACATRKDDAMMWTSTWQDTDGDNELDPIDFYTCRAPRAQPMTAKTMLKALQKRRFSRDFQCSCLFLRRKDLEQLEFPSGFGVAGLVNGMRIRMEEEDRLQREQADAMRLGGSSCGNIALDIDDIDSLAIRNGIIYS